MSNGSLMVEVTLCWKGTSCIVSRRSGGGWNWSRNAADPIDTTWALTSAQRTSGWRRATSK